MLFYDQTFLKSVSNILINIKPGLVQIMAGRPVAAYLTYNCLDKYILNENTKLFMKIWK